MAHLASLYAPEALRSPVDYSSSSRLPILPTDTRRYGHHPDVPHHLASFPAESVCVVCARLPPPPSCFLLFFLLGFCGMRVLIKLLSLLVCEYTCIHGDPTSWYPHFRSILSLVKPALSSHRSTSMLFPTFSYATLSVWVERFDERSPIDHNTLLRMLYGLLVGAIVWGGLSVLNALARVVLHRFPTKDMITLQQQLQRQREEYDAELQKKDARIHELEKKAAT